jgi:hypothetical protein
VGIVPLLKIVVVNGRKAVADRTSDQGAKASAEEPHCYTAPSGLILGAGGRERRTRSEADQSSNRGERWTRRRKC